MTSTETETPTRYTVTRRDNHTLKTHKTADEFAAAWVDVPVEDAPDISERAAVALRKRVTDRRWDGEAVMWHAGDWGAWIATADLHQQGHHDDARQLGILLCWTHQHATGHDVVLWTLAAVPARVVHRSRDTGSVFPMVCCGQTLDEMQAVGDHWSWMPGEITCPSYRGERLAED